MAVRYPTGQRCREGNGRSRVNADEDDGEAESLEYCTVFAYNHVQTGLADGISVTCIVQICNIAHIIISIGMAFATEVECLCFEYLLRKGMYPARVIEPISQ